MQKHQSSFVIDASPAEVWGLCLGSIPDERSAGPFVIETEGRLGLDELVTQRSSLEQISDGYADMHAGCNVRGVVVHDEEGRP